MVQVVRKHAQNRTSALMLVQEGRVLREGAVELNPQLGYHSEHPVMALDALQVLECGPSNTEGPGQNHRHVYGEDIEGMTSRPADQKA